VQKPGKTAGKNRISPSEDGTKNRTTSANRQPASKRISSPVGSAHKTMAHPRPAPAPKISIALRFGQRLRRLRLRRSWSQIDLAVVSGIGRTFISNMENGRHEPRLQTLADLAATFDMSISQLMRGL